LGGERSQTRAALLDAAEKLLRNEGYAAVTTRRLASVAKLKPQLVHYYFRSMDDLLVALWRQIANRNLEVHCKALASGDPLRAIWDCNRDARETTLTLEFMALARHRKALRDELAKEGERYRRRQVELLSEEFSKYGLKHGEWSPAVLAILITSVSRMLVMESEVGLSYGHGEIFRFVERWLDRLCRNQNSGTGCISRSPKHRLIAR
jgi:AcrR family transcriptional regulator